MTAAHFPAAFVAGSPCSTRSYQPSRRLVQVDRPIIASLRRYREMGKYRLSPIHILAMLLNIVSIGPKRFIRYVVEK
ncbi:hypothetical protein [Methanoculleus sp.]|uniref:hypothetical protein n=1 Tax=Methanoculleus sp. TaxID=90427 RepID=UPI0025DCD894|nr:hypothetical protein [Methanoculleus sp.]